MRAPDPSTAPIDAASATVNRVAGTPEAADGRQRSAAAGGILAALGAASCCVVPFALFMLGIGGAWIGNLTALAPYQPIFAAVALGFLGDGYYLIYHRRPTKAASAEGSSCARPSAGRAAKIGLWTATVLIVLALGFPKLAPLFL